MMSAEEKTVLSFQDITFKREEENVKAIFLKNYYFVILKEDLEAIGLFEVEDGSLVFEEREKRVNNKFNQLLQKGFNNLYHRIGNKKTLYIHQNSGIPLMGTNEFGLVDRGTNIIEVKPLTGCNLRCTFCSVSEGVNNGKKDLIVEEEYLIDEFKKLVTIKKHPVEANIGPQGEPLLYPKIVELVADLKKSGASIVSINTNGTMLNEKLIDEFEKAGLDRFNMSLHTTSQEKANDIMGGIQNIERLKQMISYCKGKIDVLLAPVLIPSVNDEDLDGVLDVAKSIENKKWPSIGVQNFLSYPGGRNPGKIVERPWKEFYSILEKKEKEKNISLMLKGHLDIFDVHEEKTLPKPFKKGEVISVDIVSVGRNKNEWFGVAKERAITVRSQEILSIGRSVKVRLSRDKHNIFSATTL